jgi:hypothetical protein
MERVITLFNGLGNGLTFISPDYIKINLQKKINTDVRTRQMACLDCGTLIGKYLQGVSWRIDNITRSGKNLRLLFHVSTCTCTARIKNIKCYKLTDLTINKINGLHGFT